MLCHCHLLDTQTEWHKPWNFGISENTRKSGGGREDFKFIARRSSGLKENKLKLTGFDYVMTQFAKEKNAIQNL